MNKPRSGRRPGSGGTRDDILKAARVAFGERGYDAATVRGIAQAAGVDPAMIHHYFGSKEDLFMATVDAPADPRVFAGQIMAGDSHDVGERLLRTILDVWESPAGVAGIALVRTSMQHDWSAKLAREFILSRGIRPIVASVEPDHERAAWRASLVASQMIGIAIARYILKVEPLASASHEAIVAAIAPTIQQYLTGEIPPPSET